MAGNETTWPARLHGEARRIARVSRVVADLDSAASFYCDCLGFSVLGEEQPDPGMLAALGVRGNRADQIVIQLGWEEVALVQFATPGRLYPQRSLSNDLLFQHLAIVVSDIDDAYAGLSSCNGWQPISLNGPQLLPPSNGGVRAFKFRDRDGHPLELIWFPPGQGRPVWREVAPDKLFLGIDHSGLSVALAARSLEFYWALGFQVTHRSLNRGPAQSRLDGLANARAEIIGLRAPYSAGMGLELLAYDPPGRALGVTDANDVLTDWVTLAIGALPGDTPRAIRDPDGHRLMLVAG
jgi:catechol 2,3-dioxygenase-like lactoylglutathione lyase family enzyme